MKYLPFGIIVVGLLLTEFVMVINSSFKSNPYCKEAFYDNFYVNWFDKIDTFNEIESIGQIMYTQYVLQFLVAGNILLLATIAAVVLTINTDTNTYSSKQIIFKQLSRNSKNSLFV